MKVIIVGGVAGGASAAARLRRLDENAEIIMLEKGGYISFANCGLPYYVGGAIKERDALLLQTPEAFNARFNVDVRINNEVVSIDRENKSVKVKSLEDGTSYVETYDKLILSPGSTPINPNIEGKSEVDNVFTLWNIPDVDRIKSYVDANDIKSAVVIGGGFIGIEMLENLYDRGIDVSLVELAPQIMAPFDFEMAQIMHSHIADKGVDLNIGTGLSKFKKVDGRTVVVLDNGKEIPTDVVIMSLGVRSQTKIAIDAGLETNQRGGIVVDEYLKTSDDNIYAVGDAVEVKHFITGEKTMIPLAGPANKQGRAVAANVLGVEKEAYFGSQGTSIAKVFDLQAGSTGLNERTLLAMGKKYREDFEVISLHPKNHAGYYPDALMLSLKVIFCPKTEKIYGAQVVGYDGADKRVDVLATAIRLNAKVTDLKNLELAYAPPFSSAKDPVNMAGFVAENILTGKVRNITYDRIKDIANVLVLDVRSELEHSMGAIPGSQLIPVDVLRDNLDKLDKNRPIAIYCAVGVRGYIAYRILLQNGFTNLYNITGGYTTYRAGFWTNSSSNGRVSSDKKESASTVADKVTQINSDTVIELDCSGLSCPGPIQKVYNTLKSAKNGDVISVIASDPGFAKDIGAWCVRTGNTLIDLKEDKGKVLCRIKKGVEGSNLENKEITSGNDKTIIVFSGDLDKAIASFIIANGSAAMGRKVTMFFTFWGLNVLRQHKKVKVKKNFIEKMFGKMMPRGTKKLALSKMNMGGMGAKMIKGIMKKHNVDTLEEMIAQAKESGVEMIACTMSMDLMGIKKEELIDGVSLAGVAAYLGAAETSDTNLFI